MRSLFLFVLLLAQTSFAEIREIKKMSEAFREVASSDLLVLDIDNTILEPKQTLGSDQWFSYLAGKTSVDAAIPVWEDVQNLTKVHAVESDTPALIRQAQQRGVVVLALTARPVSLKRETFRQLKSLGVRLANPAEDYSDGESVQLYNGVLFVGPHNNKGLVLAKFLEAVGRNPSRLIFVDDKLKHVKNMDAVFSKIANINFRYGAADERVNSFSPAIANKQWELFENEGVLVSDDEAKKLLE